MLREDDVRSCGAGVNKQLGTSLRGYLELNMGLLKEQYRLLTVESYLQILIILMLIDSILLPRIRNLEVF